MKKFYNIQYIPTGMIFNIEKEECDRLLQEEPYNFKAVDDNYVPVPEKEPDSTIQELVMGKEEPKEEEVKPKKSPAKKKK